MAYFWENYNKTIPVTGMESEAKRLALSNLISDSNRIVVLSGAGVYGKPSDIKIPDIHERKSLYCRKETVFTDKKPAGYMSSWFFEENPEEFYEYFRCKMNPYGLTPSNEHETIADLEKQGKVSCVITQNTDGLHQKAGNKNVIEIYGSALRGRCPRCNEIYEPNPILHTSDGLCRCRKCGAVIRPDIVLSDERPSYMVINDAINEVAKADCLVIDGTPLTCPETATFPSYFKGKYIIIISPVQTSLDGMANLVIRT